MYLFVSLQSRAFTIIYGYGGRGDSGRDKGKWNLYFSETVLDFFAVWN